MKARQWPANPARPRMDFNLLDLIPYGRRKEREDLPEGWPQDPAMTWLRLHDEY